MIGRLTAFARRVFKPLPAKVSSIEELVEVCMSPSLPSWDYVSLDGPWRLTRINPVEGDVYHLEQYDSFGEAVEAFYLTNHPRPDQMCQLVDARDQLVLGWGDTHELENEYRYAWWGCEFGFRALAEYDPMMAALWESIALNEERIF